MMMNRQQQPDPSGGGGGGGCAKPLANMMASIVCSSCKGPFDGNQEIVNAKGETFHSHCFVCAQCFQGFQDGIYYEFEGRKYCEFDFQLLFAPLCRGCNSYINGRVIKAVNSNWHPECFRCYACGLLLVDAGFVKNAQRPYCRECNAKEKLKSTSNLACHKCSGPIEDDGMIRYKGDIYHPYHFSCCTCGVELNASARETKDELYCLKCHDKLDLPVCAACRTPIDQQRIVYALGKQWHVEHFACAKCEIPFNGSRHYEKRGLAYCETHYNQLFGNLCFVCNLTISGDVFTSMNKSWCSDHFSCYLCDELMTQKTKFYDLDSKPVCKHCFEKLPSRERKSLLKSYESKEKDNLIKDINKFSFGWKSSSASSSSASASKDKS